MPRTRRNPHPRGLSPQPVAYGGSGRRQRANVPARHGRDPQVLPGVCGESGVHEQPDLRGRGHGVSKYVFGINRK